MKRLIALAAAALLASPAVAFAKGPIDAASACGTDGCSAVTVPPEAKTPDGMLLVFGSAPSTRPSPGPYYRLKITTGHEAIDLFYRDGKVTDGSSAAWSAVSEPLRSAIDRALAAHTAYDYRISGVLVDGRASSHPGAFAAAFGDLPQAASARAISMHADRWVTVEVLGHSPWTSLTLYYDPAAGAISTIASSERWLQAPAAMRAELDRLAGHRRSAVSSSGGWPGWQLWAGLAAALAAAAAVVAAWLRRRTRPRSARIA